MAWGIGASVVSILFLGEKGGGAGVVLTLGVVRFWWRGIMMGGLMRG